ncbi:molybdopterin molybdotransferase MoeA [Oscillatoriales cyanobacterium LEGE 11467]|uniref:Molybdopterin molybdenumtransferase n=1 Tax=Zarconia navalis LEGE 11467 TaxID=1828826 RepID=A0A928ZAI4_9CYAN|nr:gephyrin-like molybdotransferase Glp [Zarconia navalis]MBE9041726.1 molybdopterin molybdotransferase MoeA [Zarconia navalis LEGE 11467]
MLPVQDAEAIIFDLVRPFDRQQDTEAVSLLDATGRVLATPVTSALDFPHWDNSAMDGYAVRYEDVEECSDDRRVTLSVVEEIPAGILPQHSLQRGQAARILTGSMMPAGADTVVMQENTQREGDRVSISVSPKVVGEFVRHRGAFYQAGTVLMEAGVRLQAPDIAVLAAAQCTQVEVYRRPRVAILSTGSELVEPDRPLEPGQIVDSNQYALASFLTGLGVEPLRMGIVADRRDALAQAMSEAIARSDVVLSTGGVSVGDYDYVEDILAELGSEIHIRSVAVKPGKPLTVATFDRDGRSVLYFGLPGNPVSALVSCWRFVQPALQKMSGLSRGWQPAFVEATTRSQLRAGGVRETYLWGQLSPSSEGYEFDLSAGSHSSGNLINLAQTNSLAIVPVGKKSISAGDRVRVLML